MVTLYVSAYLCLLKSPWQKKREFAVAQKWDLALVSGSYFNETINPGYPQQLSVSVHVCLHILCLY